MGLNQWEWEGVGLKKTFPLISSLIPVHPHPTHAVGLELVKLLLEYATFS